jgi:hypothetical protein
MITRRKRIKTLQKVLRDITGKNYNNPLQRQFVAHFYHEFYTLWNRSYKAKSLGGTDEFGNRWAPLSSRTSGGMGPKRKKIWSQQFNQALGTFQPIMGRKDAVLKARRVAWDYVTQRTIGIDKGDLIESTEPQQVIKDHYQPAKGQLADLTGKTISVGSTVKHAKHFNRKRPLFPSAHHVNGWVRKSVRNALKEITYD